MPLAAGFVGIIPALGLLEPSKDGVSPIRLTWLHGVGWSLAVAFFGCVCLWIYLEYRLIILHDSVFLAPPIRKQVVCTLLPPTKNTP